MRFWLRSGTVVSIGLIGSGAILPSHGPSHGSKTGSRPPTHAIALQVERDVHQALTANAEAQDPASWRAGGYTPADIFRNVESLSTDHPESWKSLCDGLASLRAPDLSLFEEQIAATKQLPCAAALKARVNRYWDRASRRDGASPSGQLTPIATARAPRVVYVDPRETTTISGALLEPREFALAFTADAEPARALGIANRLAELGERGHFFFTGQAALDHPEILREIRSAGHVLGAMPFSGFAVPGLQLERAEEEISKGVRMVDYAVGGTAFFHYADPASSTAESEVLREFVRDRGLTRIQTGIDSQDWKLRDPRALLVHVLDELERQGGGILRFDTRYRQTAIVLPELLAELANRGYSPVVFRPSPGLASAH